MKLKIQSQWLLGIATALVLSGVATIAGAADRITVHWTFITPNFTPPITLNPGGSAQAIASDGSTITIAGSGTFVAPDGERESSRAVTGGGSWKIVSTSGTTAGTFVVTEVVQWGQSTAFAGFGLVDNVGNINQAFGGLAVLRVAYSDGSEGVLTISCNAPADPPAIFEGMIASKGLVQYWNPSIFKYFSEFHVFTGHGDD
jgi:hypothetical protein